MSENNDKLEGELNSFRQRIDALDERIIGLLNDRAKVVVEVGLAKQAEGKPIYAPGREKAVFDRIDKLNTGPLLPKTLRAIYREMISGSYALERPQRIGYLGPEGSFSHLASMRKFGSSVEYYPLTDIRAIFGEVGRGHCDMGLVPIENSLGGGIIDTMDSFIGANVFICGEVLVEIHHNVLARCPAEQIKTLASKPEVFAQCREWISTSFRQAELLPVASTSKAAEMASHTEGLAAIGSALAAELYDLNVIFSNIEDKANNTTRFFIISTTPAKKTGSDKTALYFTTAHKSGALVGVLNVFSRHGVNLTNIDTRPSRGRNWEYYFFVDADGHCEEEHFREALAEAGKHCGELHVLGSFPRAEETV